MALTIGAEDKKKLYILMGLGGALAVVWTVVFNPFGFGKKPATPIAQVSGEAQPTGAATPAGEGASAGAEAEGTKAAAAPAAAPGGTTATANLITVERFRPDPFTPYYTRVITPPPLPPPPPPIPDPLSLPQPRGEAELAPASLGTALPSARGGLAPSTALVQLPPMNIPQFRTRSAPRLGAPQMVSGGSGSAATRSPNKRIAGVIIGDSVRALIEISEADQTITRVVQPGDEVEGIKILRIERVTENDTLTTRMTVLENGQERYFDLRPSPNPVAGAAGATGAVGVPMQAPRGAR
ncbi:MAG TPA: hypothetical protein VF681_06115 [Abditibacteriaceae bacterium]|jgi:hypothetical protein